MPDNGDQPIRDAIKDQLLEKIREEKATEKRHDALSAFHNFVDALETEARTKEAETRTAIMTVQLQRDAAARHGCN